MRCPAVAGWQERVTTKVGAAACTGLLGGGLYAIVRRGPLLRWAIATSASFTICEATFCGIQELVRLLRCHVSPANSLIAGGAAGYILTALHSGSQKALPPAIICAAACGAADASWNWLDVRGQWQRTLISLDLLDKQDQQSEDKGRQPVGALDRDHIQPSASGTPVEPKFAPEYHHTGTWRDLLPIHKLSEEEWEAYQRKKAADFQARVDRVTKGEPPDPEKE